MALEEAQKSFETIEQSWELPAYKMRHQLQLLGLPTSNVPSVDTDVVEIAIAMPEPVEFSGLKLIPTEKDEVDNANAAANWQEASDIFETIACMFHVFPTVGANGMPLGVGVDVKWGLGNLANAVSAVARVSSKNHLVYTGSRRGLVANSSAYEIKNFDKQVLAQRIRITMVNHDIGVQQRLSDKAHEIEEFLKSKYTNKELYEWLQKGVQGLYLYCQVYTMAHSWAKKAELGPGERLYMGLKQMEEAYNETRGYNFEVTKFVSLRQTSPISLLQLAYAGRCNFTLPEVLFDMDFPPLLPQKKIDFDHNTKVNEDGDRFRTNAVPISAIAVSSARSDAGVFDLNFHDERFMPFEGAGCISEWKLELPDGFRQFDYCTITDVILQLRYTARGGGASLATAAAENVASYIRKVADDSQVDGPHAMFDVKNEFATTWYQGMHPQQPGGPRVIARANLAAKLPVFTKGRDFNDLVASDVLIVTDSPLSPSALQLSQGQDNNSTGFDDARSASFKSMSVYAAHGLTLPIDQWALTITDTVAAISSMWIVVPYIMR
ncbi:Toxin subunit YenA2 [Paramyrothecium foliicola]|nr:Toxin subunit YenA2 [Paramyrothecium foliicola]